MATMLPDTDDAMRRETLAGLRPKPAKASLHQQPCATPLREVAANAVRRTSSQKAAAVDIGLNEGRLSHKLKDGSLTLAQLEKLGPLFAAELGVACKETYGENDPKAEARRELREIRSRLDRVEELIA